MMRLNSIMKKVMVITAVSVMVTGLTACGSRKKATGDTASGGELNAAGKIEKESTEESKMYLQNTSDEKIVLTDEEGNEITITEGETLPVKEKTTDKAGEEIYVLEDGSKIKASSVNSSAKEVVTTISSGNKGEKSSNNLSKETSKSVVKNEENITQPPTQSQPQSVTEAATQQTTQVQPKPTEVPTQPPTQSQPQPVTEAPTQPPTQSQPQPTEAPTQPVTEAPTKASYTGYREDLDQRAAQMIVELRNSDNTAVKNPTWNEHLYKVAQIRAKELATNFSHDSTSNARSGYNIGEALTKFDITYYSSDIAQVAIDAWCNSTEHYRILTKGDTYAVACYQQGNYVYWVMLEGTTDIYIAENVSAIQASEWGQPGSPKYEEKYQKYYNSFVSQHGERNIW